MREGMKRPPVTPLHGVRLDGLEDRPGHQFDRRRPFQAAPFSHVGAASRPIARVLRPPGTWIRRDVHPVHKNRGRPVPAIRGGTPRVGGAPLRPDGGHTDLPKRPTQESTGGIDVGTTLIVYQNDAQLGRRRILRVRVLSLRLGSPGCLPILPRKLLCSTRMAHDSGGIGRGPPSSGTRTHSTDT